MKPPELPSEEQRECTAAKYARRVPVLESEPKPTHQIPAAHRIPVQRVVVHQPAPQKHWFWHLSLLKQVSFVITAIGVGLVVIGKLDPGFTFNHHVKGNGWNGTVPNTDHVHALVVGVAILCGYWWIALMFLYVRSFHRTLGEGLRPVPSFAEIEQEFLRNGYNPSAQDCIAMHQHLTSQRNQAFLVAGAMVVGTNVAARQASVRLQ